MRTVVIGGAGNFGARIVRALQSDPDIELMAASRGGGRVSGAEGVTPVALDIDASDFAQRLKALAPALVIHCVGPFQGQDYRVAKAALSVGAHYIDLADGRQFVAEFAAGINDLAVAAGRVAICGASTLPALSSAVVERLKASLASLQSIEIVIAPGQRAPRGEATLAAVFSYLGRSFPVWRKGKWGRAWGWMNLRRARLDIGTRLAAACDVPDLVLFPERYGGVQTVLFHAALEIRVQHLVLWSLASLRRVGMPLPVDRWAMRLNRFAGWFDASAGDKGGMMVSITGQCASSGKPVRRTWHLAAPATHGPQIPAMPAIMLARRFARGDFPAAGAFPCMGFLALADFDPLFRQWGITTRVAEEAA